MFLFYFFILLYMQKFNDISPIAYLILGIVLGLVIYGYFLKPDIETRVEYRETIKTDTVYVTKTETITKTQFKYIYERDTIIENYQPKIRGFKELYPFTYGNVSITGEVLGELRYINITADFRLPTVTNTITKEKNTTIIKKPSGIFLTAGMNSNLTPSIGGMYLRDKSLINYSYQPSIQVHSISVGWKVF
jgi:hypothetical protein